MTAQEARTHIRYSGWASRKVLEAALALSPEDRAKPMSVSHESIAKTLTHIYFADAIWYSRIADPSYPVPSHDALPSLDFVVQEWPRLQAKWEAWSDAVTDADIARHVPFKSRFVDRALEPLNDAPRQPLGAAQDLADLVVRQEFLRNAPDEFLWTVHVLQLE